MDQIRNMSLLESTPAGPMTFRKEEGTAMGRFHGCLLSKAREGIEALHRTEGKRKFQLKAELGAPTGWEG